MGPSFFPQAQVITFGSGGLGSLKLFYVAGLSVLMCVLTGGVAIASEPHSHPSFPSILLITLDTTRADRLGAYGNKDGLTPSLDEFAKSATLFQRCEAPAPQTEPSHVTIFSGWYPARHGVRKNLNVDLAAGVPLLAENFKKGGYQTGAFVSSYVLLGHFGLDRGFDEYDASFYDLRKPASSVERRSAETLSKATEWLKGRASPWFCWIHLYDAHSPYNPPSPFREKYKGNSYNGEIAYMDSALGGFFSWMRSSGMDKNTIMVVCADHGESLGEHGEPEHGVFLYDATTRVPLLIHMPKQTAPQSVSRDVSLVDIAPTLRDLCGLPSASSDGVSLVPLLRGEPIKRGPAVIESLVPLLDYGWAPLYAAVNGHFKFILAPRPELYDLAEDPMETKNIIGDNPKEGVALEKVLKQYIVAEEGKSLPSRNVSLGEEEMQSLRSLGYLSGGGAPVSRKIFKDPKDCITILNEIYKSVATRKAGHEREAVALLEDALARDPGNATVLFLIGQTYEDFDKSRAEAAYREAIRAMPSYPQPYIRLVTLLLESGRYQASYDTATVAISQAHDYSGMLNVLKAWAAFRLDKPRLEVMGALDEARKHAPERPLALKLKALLSIQDGDKEQALSYLGRMANCAPCFLMKAVGNDDDFKVLREDARFWSLVMCQE